MALKSYSRCPCCESDIVLEKGQGQAFVCPHCGAEFRHNYKRWALAIPVALVVTICFLYLLSDLAIWIVIGGVYVASIFAGGAPEYVVDVPGRKVERLEMPRQKRESAFFKVSITFFFLVAMGALAWSATYAMKFLLRWF